jgi:hypothetical protein
MAATPEEIAERIDARIRREWPGMRVSSRKAFIAPEIGDGGVTDTLLQLVRRVVEEELERETLPRS